MVTIFIAIYLVQMIFFELKKNAVQWVHKTEDASYGLEINDSRNNLSQYPLKMYEFPIN